MFYKDRERSRGPEMKKKRQSAVWNLAVLVRLGRRISEVLRKDMISVYAAQASFFILMSAFPFLMLLLRVIHLMGSGIPGDLIGILEDAVPAEFRQAFSALLRQLSAADSVPLLSVTAGAALWSASRGMAALERGMAGVYGIDIRRGLLRDVLRSVVYTAALILLIFTTLLLLVFGRQIADSLMTALPALQTPLLRLMHARGLLVFLVLSVFFTLWHHVILRRAYPPHRRPLAFPGGMLSGAGWMLFSFLYSLYMEYFPRASYLVGGLALLLILMLWLYFCMIIFLCGAEVNKLIFRRSGAEEK